jgi:hypothetical protein
MSRSLAFFSWRHVRPLAALLLACLVLPGCYYYNASYSYSVTVTAVADNNTVFTAMSVTLASDYDIDGTTVYITDQDWSVTTAPALATYALDDDGRDATFIPLTPGTYVVRYRTWYYTSYDYDYCYCTYYTSYRESYVTINVLPAPSA